MRGRRHPKRILSDQAGAGRTLKSFEGLDADTGSDYEFHKDVLELDVSELPRTTQCISCGDKMITHGSKGDDVCPKCLDFFSRLDPPPEGITY